MKEKCVNSLLSMLMVLFCITAFVGVMSSPAWSQPEELLLQDTAILVENGLEIGGYFDLVKGHICVKNGNMVLGGKGNVRLPTSAPTPSLDSKVVSALGTVTVRNFTKVSNLYAPGGAASVSVTGTSGVSIGAIASASDVVCPDFPPFPTFVAAGTQDVVCTQAGTDIDPSETDYRDLIVQFKGKCNFTKPGIYNFRKILANTNSDYQFNFAKPQCDPEDGYVINVEQFVTLGEYGSFNALKQASSVFINVKGVDDSYSGTNPNPNSPFTGQPSAFLYRGDGEFNACDVHVPNGTIALRGKSDVIWSSQWKAKWMFEFSTLRIRTQVPVDYVECCTIKDRDCACILKYPQTANIGETITVKGKALTKKTVLKVLFFKEANVSILDFENAAASADCEVPQADITFVDPTKMTFAVPASCATGFSYRLAIDNGALCIDKVDLLAIP